MATQEEIMLMIDAKDNASNVLNNIDKNAKSMSQNLLSGITNLNSGMMNVSNSFNSMLSSVTNGKSAGDLIFGTTSKAETNSVLLKMMSSTEDAASKLNAHVDDVTNSSLVSMQNLIPALNAFKTATGATDEQIYNATEGIANFGAKVLAQTGSTELAEQAMMDLSKGIKGACASLDQYGITEDALMRTGKWSGDEQDIEGFISAVEELTGDSKELLETNEGLDALMGKAFSSAGKKIGNEFLPQIKDAKKAFIDLNKATGGNLAAGIIVATESVDMLSSGLSQFSQISNGIKDIKDGFKDIKSAADGLKDSLKGVGSATETATDALKTTVETGTSLGDVADVADGLDDLKDMNDVAKKTGDTVDAAEDIASAGAGFGAASGEMATATAGATSFSGAFAGFGASLGAMLAPLLLVAAVIAIMIPVVAGIVVEVLIFVRAIMEVMKALDFDSVDLSGAISGLQSFGTAMWELAKATAAITVTTVLVNIANAISFLQGGIANSIRTLVDSIKQIIPVMNQLNDIEISEDVGSSLTTFAEAMNQLNSAVGSLMNVQWSVMMGNFMTLGGLFGNMETSISSAVSDIKTAVSKLGEFESLEMPSNDVGPKITQIADALKPVAEAIKSLKGISDAEFSWNPLTNFTKALETAKSDIEDASLALSHFDSSAISDPGTEVGPKITRVADALKPVAEAIKSLASISDAEFSWNPLTNLISALETAKQDIVKASEVLSTFKSANITDPGDEVGPKITRIANALKTVKAAIDSIKAVSDAQTTWNPLTNFIASLESAKLDIQKAAEVLKNFGSAEMPDPGNEVGPKVTRVANALKTVKSAIDSLNMISQAQTTWNPLTNLTNSINSAKTDITNAANALNGLSGIPDVPAGTATKILNVANGLKPLKQAVDSINQNPIPVVTGGTQNISQAVLKVKEIARSLNSLNGTTVNAGGALTSVKTAINQIKSILTTSVGSISSSATNIGKSIGNGIKSGMSNIGGQLRSVMTSAMGQVKSAATSGATQTGNSARTALQSSFKLANIVQTEMQHMVDAINNKKSAIIEAIRSLANDATTTFTLELDVQSPGLMARTMKAEMGYINESVTSKSANVISSVRKLAKGIVEAFGSPVLTVDTDLASLNNINGFNGTTLSNIGVITGNVSVPGNTNDAPIINIHEGAIQLDARNLTTAESKKIMINALEGLDQIRNINIRGV